MNKNINSQDIKNLNTENLNWTDVQAEMKSKLGSEVFDSWLRKISFLQEFNNYLLLSVPTRFIRDWITSRYLDQILKIVKIYKKEIIRVEFKIVDQKDNLEDADVLKNATEVKEEKAQAIKNISNKLEEIEKKAEDVKEKVKKKQKDKKKKKKKKDMKRD